ncbi:MAG: YihY family inner membrane protein [Nitrospirae bacterium]|nr:MAG: YihY family inner membrane protein [Nitrospirota bacterium]
MSSLSYFFSQRIWEFDLGKVSPLKGFFIKFFRFLYIVYREFTLGQLNLRAMGLVYTTLLSLVPLLAVVFSVLKAFGGHELIRPLLLRLFEPLGQNAHEVVNRIMSFVENLRVGVLGFVGMLLLLFTVISLLKKIEDALNWIWRVKKQRALVRRVSNYVSIIILGPILLFSSVALSTTIKKSTLIQGFLNKEAIGGVIVVISSVMPFISIILTFFLIYIFIPNVKVKPRSAFVGAAVAAILWHFIGLVFAEFVATANKYTIIYSTFAVLILFIIWLYLGWFVLLAGAEIAYYHQYPQFLSVKEEHVLMSNRMRERVSIAILYLMAKKAIEGTLPLSINEIVQKLNLPFHLVQEVMDILQKSNLVIETAGEFPSYVPAHDIGTIKMNDIYKSIRTAGQKLESMTGGPFAIEPVDEIMMKIDRAIDSNLGKITLKDIAQDEQT